MKRILLTLAVISAISVASCYYDSEESLYPAITGCDTVNISYTRSVYPVLDNNCLGCHSSKVSKDKGGDINLEGYSNVVLYKDAILGSIRHENGAKPMPKNADKLSDCLIRQVEKWNEAGAPDN
jgi:hypothetical protein